MTAPEQDPRHLHLAFDLSFTHTEGRWARPGSWTGRTFPDVKMFQELAITAEPVRADAAPVAGAGAGRNPVSSMLVITCAVVNARISSAFSCTRTS